ncbi:MAG: hypothetical protein JWN79_1372 [Gemmatimonadetes bacterium]|jgi:hypothetical protein|nr:hypothetical protein [Gemmatimonadota bacterium]
MAVVSLVPALRIPARLRRSATLAILLAAGIAVPSRAQLSTCPAAGPVPPDASYSRCALSIVPAWNGLLLARGASAERLGNLAFFWPHPIARLVTGDSARESAGHAFVTRRRAAVLTDLGGLLLLAGVAGAARRGDIAGTPRALAVAGAAMFAASIPLHFAADGWMSRAVWWHNTAYSR